MFISEQLLYTINQTLKQSQRLSGPLSVAGVIHGGSINRCFRLKSGKESFFLKVNSQRDYPEMFMKEAMALKLLDSTHSILVPQVISYGAAGDEQFLLLQWINTGANTSRAQERLGEGLAALHHHSASGFGLDYTNYMGSLIQSNRPHAEWVDFFVEERLKPQVKIAADKWLIDQDTINKFNLLFCRMKEFLPEVKPALVHGDLWSGNYMIGEGETPVLIDPAIAYANRECDIAMSKLFGGFDEIFYESYNHHFPLEKNWNERTDLWNLYPLLIHLNLFGRSYLAAIKAALKRYL
ncbi:fructosamine kinase family protein [Arcticibacter tournemirensis]|uniref:Ketosamine-3-kinase n=1 Tax=Arcticibacter tournemirensis TaxID=699437 RepID=A0A4Q0MFS3_9SPHI|nr:fructosamine kinase family protein [Arcticibacter tournemirensis]RXF72338.1 ketosamine-3-kinase [Arcticibacter tournemirensis]